MKDFDSVDAILDYAIGMEQAAVDLYVELAAGVQAPAMREVFLAFAQEERGHRAKLEAAKSGKRPLDEAAPIRDLKIADYLDDVTLSDRPSYGDILVFAMKREKQAFRLYNDLAERIDDPGIRQLFLTLAQEEAKHKLRFELEYDQQVLKEN